MREPEGRPRVRSLGVAAGYGLVLSVFTTYALAIPLRLATAGRLTCAAVTILVLVVAAAVLRPRRRE